MEQDESFIWALPALPSSSAICRSCGYFISLQPRDTETGRPFFACYNQRCRDYLKIFVVGDECKIAVFDTHRSLPDPNRIDLNIPTAEG